MVKRIIKLIKHLLTPTSVFDEEMGYEEVFPQETLGYIPDYCGPIEEYEPTKSELHQPQIEQEFICHTYETDWLQTEWYGDGYNQKYLDSLEYIKDKYQLNCINCKGTYFGELAERYTTRRDYHPAAKHINGYSVDEILLDFAQHFHDPETISCSLISTIDDRGGNTYTWKMKLKNPKFVG